MCLTILWGWRLKGKYEITIKIDLWIQKFTTCTLRNVFRVFQGKIPGAIQLSTIKIRLYLLSDFGQNPDFRSNKCTPVKTCTNTFSKNQTSEHSTKQINHDLKINTNATLRIPAEKDEIIPETYLESFQTSMIELF